MHGRHAVAKLWERRSERCRWGNIAFGLTTALLAACGGAEHAPTSQVTSKTPARAASTHDKLPTPLTSATGPSAADLEQSPSASRFELVAESDRELRLAQAGDSVFVLDSEMLLARASDGELQTGSAVRAGLPTCDAVMRWRTTPRWHGKSFTIRGLFGDNSEKWLSADIPRNDGTHGALYRWSSGQWRLAREQHLPFWSYDDLGRWSGERWVALVGRSSVCMSGGCEIGPDDGCRAPKRDACEGMPKKSDHRFEIVAGPPRPLPTPISDGVLPQCSKRIGAARMASFPSGEIFTFGLGCSQPSEILCERWSPRGSRSQETLLNRSAWGFFGLVGISPSNVVLSTPAEITRFDGTTWRNVQLPRARFSITSVALDPEGLLWVAGFDADGGRVLRQQPIGEWQSLALPRTLTTDATEAPYLPEELGLTSSGAPWLVARHPDCALIANRCRRGIFYFGPTQGRRSQPVQHLDSGCKSEEEADVPLVEATPACTNVFVRLSGPRRSEPTDQYLAIRTVLRGHHEFAGATFGTFHPSGGAWFAAGGLSYALAQQLVALVSKRLPHLRPMATCETPTLGSRMHIDFATGSVLSVQRPSNEDRPDSERRWRPF